MIYKISKNRRFGIPIKFVFTFNNIRQFNFSLSKCTAIEKNGKVQKKVIHGIFKSAQRKILYINCTNSSSIQVNSFIHILVITNTLDISHKLPCWSLSERK